jgi:hypothetical protein
LGDPRAETSVSYCDSNVTGWTGVVMSVAVSNDCGRALVPATRDMFILGREGSAKERANEEKEGKDEDGAEDEVVSVSRGGAFCFGGDGSGGGWPSALAQASRARCSS